MKLSDERAAFTECFDERENGIARYNIEQERMVRKKSEGGIIMKNSIRKMMDVMDALTCVNKNKTMIGVIQSNLERVDDGPYKSVCPICRYGTLLIGREKDGLISQFDHCVLCAQRFQYLDHVKLLEMEQ